MQEDTEALELRERSYLWTKMHSFGLLKKANFTTCQEHLNRHRVLELVYQHMHSIGMHHAAFTLAEESQLEFQRKDQKMDRTDLRLLVSLSLGPRDDLWDSTGIDSTVLVEEQFDDDNGSVNYIEPVGDYKTPLGKVTFDGAKEFKYIKLAPLKALVAMLVKEHEPVVTDADKEMFFVTLNSICRSEHLFKHLCAMFDEVEEADRDHVFSFIEQWLRFLGLFVGKRTLRAMQLFLETKKNEMPRALELLEMIQGLKYGHPIQENEPPSPKIAESTSVRLLSPELTLAEPEPEEVARQITLRAQKIFSAIHPREFYFAIADRSLSPRTPGLNELMEFGHNLKLLIASTIVTSDAPVSEITARFVEIMEQLLRLRNFESLSWCLSALNMKGILSLTKGLSCLPRETAEKLENLRVYDWKAESSGYEKAVSDLTSGPTIPNMRYELSIVATEGYDGDDFVDGLINWEKRRKAAKNILRYYHYQNVLYSFHVISQIQGVLERGPSLTKEGLSARIMERGSPITHEEPM